MKNPELTVYMAAPRGFCAGVDRAIKIVEMALEKWGEPVYVRHEIVHNKYVVDELKSKGAIFIKEVSDAPVDRPIIFSAHGVPKSVPLEAKSRKMIYVDATCPLVSKVHIEADRHFENGLQIIMIGHEGHPETIGTMGQLPEGGVLLVESTKDVENLIVRDPSKLAYVTQTTLSIDDTAEVVEALKTRFPTIVGPHKEDICYATTNRQMAIKNIAKKCEMLFVIGSSNSSNSQRLVEVAKQAGCQKSYLIDEHTELPMNEISQCKNIGISSGASAPEAIVTKIIEKIKKELAISLEEISIAKENIEFKIPRELN